MKSYRRGQFRAGVPQPGKGGNLIAYAQAHPQRLAEAKREGKAWQWQTRGSEAYAQLSAAGAVRAARARAVRKAADWARVCDLRTAGLSWARVAYMLGLSKSTLYHWARKEL